MTKYIHKDLFNDKRILNVGCGNDDFGTDFIDLYPMNKNVKKCDVDKKKYPYRDGTFDVIYSRCNFEHLSNPSHFINESYRILKKDGLLIIVTDNANYFGFAFSEGHHLKYSGYGIEDLHYGLYTPEHLETHLRAKFKIWDSGYVNGDILDWRKNSGLRELKKILGIFAAIPNKYFKRIFNSRIYVVGTKK